MGFSSEVKNALRQRADLLTEQALVERRWQRVVLARNPLATLCGHELAQDAKNIAADTGLVLLRQQGTSQGHVAQSATAIRDQWSRLTAWFAHYVKGDLESNRSMAE